MTGQAVSDGDMVLSNAERQRRYLARLKAAASGVTPDDINRARRIMFEYIASDPADRSGTWEEFVERCKKRKFADNWAEMLPDRGDPGYWEEYGDDAEFMAKVGAVIEAINKMPG